MYRNVSRLTTISLLLVESLPLVHSYIPDYFLDSVDAVGSRSHRMNMRFILPQTDTASAYNLQNLVPVWLTLHIAGGQVGLPLVVLTFIFAPRSAGRPRYLTLINFCVTWIVYSIVYCLLLYSGQADGDLETPTKLCLAQASLIHGAPPMTAVAGFEMVLQLWFVQKQIHMADFPYSRKISSRVLDTLILAPPYIAFISFSLLTLGHGIHDKDMILSLNHVYCTTQNYRFSLIVPTFCAVVMAGIIFIEAMICCNWCRARKEVNTLFALYHPNEVAAISRAYQRRRLSISISIRVGLFTLYSVASLSACLVFVSNMPISFPYMVEASLPIAAFLLFGTQKDILELWFCCKRLHRTGVTGNDDEKEIPSARSPSLFPSIESILSPSILTVSTLSEPGSLREVTGSEEVEHDGSKESRETVRPGPELV